jgi:hypothetical protein
MVSLFRPSLHAPITNDPGRRAFIRKRLAEIAAARRERGKTKAAAAEGSAPVAPTGPEAADVTGEEGVAETSVPPTPPVEAMSLPPQTMIGLRTPSKITESGKAPEAAAGFGFGAKDGAVILAGALIRHHAICTTRYAKP